MSVQLHLCVVCLYLKWLHYFVILTDYVVPFFLFPWWAFIFLAVKSACSVPLCTYIFVYDEWRMLNLYIDLLFLFLFCRKNY